MIPAVRAEEWLAEGRGENLTAKGLRNLVLQATGSAKEADDAFNARVMSELSAAN